MTRFRYDNVYKYHIKAKTISPLHIGSSMGGNDEILKDSLTGIPYIQASSIAGMLRDVCDSVNGDEVTESLFGASRMKEGEDDARSRVKVSDGHFDNSTIVLELRPGVSIDRTTGAARKENGAGHKFDITYVSAGAKAEFDLYLYTGRNDSSTKENFEKVLGVFRSREAQLGSKKSSGAGKFVAESIQRAYFDLTSEEGRINWRDEYKKEDYVDITSNISPIHADTKYLISIYSETEGPILVKGISMSEFGEGAADCENLKNGVGDYIVPGTSIRGTVRSQMEKIAAYLKKNSIIGASFGVLSDSYEDSRCGNLVFNDAVIGTKENNRNNPIRSRIHIDKFTGGVMSQALFSEQNANGKLDMSIEILNKNDPDATLGLLLYALRDLANNSYILGGGYATGKGFIRVSKIVISDGSNKAELRFDENNSSIGGKKEIIDVALGKLKEVQG